MTLIGIQNVNIDLIWFDFHCECKKMKYENLSKLLKMNSVSQGLAKFDFLHVIVDTNQVPSFSPATHLKNVFNVDNVQKETIQKGTFRTNCIDSLDRSNVVQTVFARQVLHDMLYKLNLAAQPTGDPFQPFTSVFEIRFKNEWADHGDFLATAYSGTGALKSDFTRTGKRTWRGALEDGVKTSKRFYINNFMDGYNQDCHDYFLGKLNPKKQEFKEHSDHGIKIIVPATLMLVFVIYNFLIGLSFSKEHEDNFNKKLLKLIIFLCVFFLTFRTVFVSLKKSLIAKPTIDEM